MTNIESAFRYPVLFRLGWWLFFAGSLYLGWNSLGILLLLLHLAIDHRAVASLTRSGDGRRRGAGRSLGGLLRYLVLVLLGIGGAGLVSSLLAIEPGRGVAATVGMVLSMAFGLLYGAVLQYTHPGWFRAYLWPAVVAGAVHIGWVFWEAGHVESLWYRVETVAGPNGTGTMMLLAVCLGVAWFVGRKDAWRWASVPYITGAIAAMVLTQSRGSWLALVAFGICILVPAAREPLRNRYVLGAVMGAMIVFVLVMSYVPGAAERLRISSNPAEEGRIAVYQIAWDMFLDHIWFGVGPANFGNHWDEYNRGRSEEDVGFPHNTWLQALTETGLVGGVLFAVLIGRVLLAVWRIRQTGDWQLWAVASSVVAVLVRDQVDAVIFNINTGFLFWWMAGTVLASERLIRRRAAS